MKISQALLIVATLIVGTTFEGKAAQTANDAFSLNSGAGDTGLQIRPHTLMLLKEEYENQSMAAKVGGDEVLASLYRQAASAIGQKGFRGFEYFDTAAKDGGLHSLLSEMDPNHRICAILKHSYIPLNFMGGYAHS